MLAIDPILIIFGGAAAVAIAFLTVFLARGRRQRIDLGETNTRPTLQRQRSGGAAPIAAAIDSDLTRIKGLGSRAAAQLFALGYGNIAALATLDDASATELDAKLGAFSGRLINEQWVEQAQLLASEKIAEFETRFGKLDGER